MRAGDITAQIPARPDRGCGETGAIPAPAFPPQNTAPDFLQQPTTPAAAKAHHRKDQAASGIAGTYRLRMVSNGAPNIEDNGREVEFILQSLNDTRRQVPPTGDATTAGDPFVHDQFDSQRESHDHAA